MPVAVQRPPQIETELYSYIKDKTGLNLNNTSSPLALSTKGVVVNDNNVVQLNAMHCFIKNEKQQNPINRDIPKDKMGSANIALAQKILTAAVGTILEQELDKDQAAAFLDNLAAIKTLETFQEQDLSTYVTPAIQQLKTEITKKEAHIADFYQIRLMAIAHEARSDIPFENPVLRAELEEELGQMTLKEIDPDEAAMKLHTMTQENRLTHDLWHALQTLAGDGNPPDVFLADGLKGEEIEIEDGPPKSTQELIQQGRHIVIRDGNGNDHTVNSEEVIRKELAEEAVNTEYINQDNQLSLTLSDQVEQVCGKKHNIIKPDHLLYKETAQSGLKPVLN